jgi:hypothetical protein
LYFLNLKKKDIKKKINVYYNKHKRIVMCFDETTSLLTFLLGTLLNVTVAYIVITRNYSFGALRLAILALWQFALLMQLPEAAQWRHLSKSTDPTSAHKNAAHTAYWLNTLQPAAAALLLGIVAMVSGRTRLGCALLAAVPALTFTALAVLNAAPLLRQHPDIRPLQYGTSAQSCAHLNLHWWNKHSSLYRALPLYVAGIAAPLLLLPLRLAIVQYVAFFGTLAISQLLYPCGTASLWCWSVAAAGLTVLVP